MPPPGHPKQFFNGLLESGIGLLGGGTPISSFRLFPLHFSPAGGRYPDRAGPARGPSGAPFIHLAEPAPNMKPENEVITVLLADDDEAIVKAICRRMRSERINLILAVDGYQAVSLARQHEPDVIVLDVNMPAGDGFTVANRLETIPGLGQIPIIYITGEQTPRVAAGAIRSHAAKILYKPFDTSDLVAAIRTAALDAAA